jgi:prepilin-type N-terminal cleavage/methylation domain-containing protein
MANRYFKQQGFSLIEMAISMVVFGLFFTVIAYLIFGMDKALHGTTGGRAADKSMITTGFGDGSQATIKKALLFFVKNNHRLPCPDISNNGQEDCATTNQVGTLPYLALGYATPVVDSRNNAIRYGVYRNSTNDADLTINKNRFAPLIPADPPGGTVVTPTTANTPDFCKALENAWETGTNSTAYVHTTDGTNIRNAAYILAIGGQRDADNNGAFFDGVNGSGIDFELSSRVENGNYDDLVGTQSFLDLYQLLNCVVRIAEVNGAALDAQVAELAAIAAATSVGNAESDLGGAERDVDEATFDIVLAGIAVLNATVSVAAAATGLAEKSIPDILNTVVAAAALVKAIADVVIAEQRLVAANATRDQAQQRLDDYEARLPIANAYAKARFDFATIVELNGGLK